MGAIVRLKSPAGKVKVYDPAEYDIPAMLRDGYQRAGNVMIAAHARSWPTRKQETTFTPNEIQSAGITPADVAASEAQNPPKEPWAVSQIPTALGIAGNVAGRVVGGTAGAASGALTLGSTSIPGVVVGQQAGGSLGGGLGQGTGEAVRQGVDHLLGVPDPADPMGEIRNQALLGAVMGPAGELLGAGVQGVGKAAMGAALKFTPEVAQTAIREGIAATRGGLSKAMTLLGEYGQRTTQFMRTLQNRGASFDPVEVLDRAGQALKPALDNNQIGEAPEILAKFAKYARTFMGKWSGQNTPVTNMTPLELQAFKQQADQIAKPIFDALNDKQMANSVTADDRAKAHFFKAAADAARDMLENKAEQLGVVHVDPVTGASHTLADLNRQTGQMIALKDELAPQVGKGIGVAAQIAKRAAVPFGAGMAAGATMNPGHRLQSGLEYGIGGAALSSPEVLSHLALLLNSPAVAMALRALPYAGAAAVQGQR